jgi:hypothetical protein
LRFGGQVGGREKEIEKYEKPNAKKYDPEEQTEKFTEAVRLVAPKTVFRRSICFRCERKGL